MRVSRTRSRVFFAVTAALLLGAIEVSATVPAGASASRPQSAGALGDGSAPSLHLDVVLRSDDVNGDMVTKFRDAVAFSVGAATPEDAAVIAEAVARGASLPGAVLVASVVCSCVRGAVRPSLRRDALGLLSRVAAVADDDARLQLIVPFCVASAADGAAAVRAAAVRALAETTRRVETFPASDAKVFPEFVWPSLSGLARDREESVRVAYAASLASLARASARFLQRANEGSEDAADGLSMSAYEDDLASLRALVRGAVLGAVGPRCRP